MNPELLNALIAAGSALASAVAVWIKMRRGGKPSLPPIGPIVPGPVKPDFPSTGRPILDLIIRRYLQKEAEELQAKHEAEADAYLLKFTEKK